jgi:hypothetical protein
MEPRAEAFQRLLEEHGGWWPHRCDVCGTDMRSEHLAGKAHFGQLTIAMGTKSVILLRNNMWMLVKVRGHTARINHVDGSVELMKDGDFAA